MSTNLAIVKAGYVAFNSGNMNAMRFFRIIVDEVSNANSSIPKHSPEALRSGQW
jgi:hypothetical protein